MARSMHRLFGLAYLALIACQQPKEQSWNIRDGWEFQERSSERWHAAEVPGDVMLDLMRTDQLVDPYFGTNEERAAWIGSTDWSYRRIFGEDELEALSKMQNPELVFEGLDTYATVVWNSDTLVQSQNMHRKYRCTLPNTPEPSCTLYVHFDSPIKRGQVILDQAPRLIPVSNELQPLGRQTSSVTRKAKYQYGWDWGPRLVSAGIWRPVYIESARSVQREDVWIELKSLTDEQAIYQISGPAELTDGTFECTGPGEKTCDYSVKLVSSNRYELIINRPERWWPIGMGDQPLYTLTWSNDRQSVAWNFGIRTLEWVMDPDKWGNSFACRVNGQIMFCRGANIIPADFFPSRGLAREMDLIDYATNANMNMLRVWGGAVYPSDQFFELCDAKGLLIWSDFMFACAMVRGDSAFHSQIESEAIYQVKRSRNHPSLALWCGNNESLRAWNEWGWQELYNLHGEDSIASADAYERVFNQILPEMVAEHSDAFYWPSSPMPLPGAATPAGSGDDHAWRIWFDTLDFNHYSHHPGRFASEYGLQSLPNRLTLEHAGIQYFDDAALQFRQRSRMDWLKEGMDGWDMMRNYASRYTADPVAASFQDLDTLDRWIYLTQLTQAIGLREGIERHRASNGRYAGSLYWQLNDVWPAVSWSTVDYEGRYKLAHYAVRHANATKRAIWNRNAFELDPEALGFYVVNDTPVSLRRGLFEVKLIDMAGNVIESQTFPMELEPFSSTTLTTQVWNDNADLTRSVLTWRWMDEKGAILDQGAEPLLKPSEMQWPNATVTLKMNPEHLVCSSDSVAYGVWIQSNRDCQFSNNGFLLLPGPEGAQNLFWATAAAHKDEVPAPSFTVRHFQQFQ